MTVKTEVHKRKIGSVIIFDLFGDISEGDSNGIMKFIEANIQKGGFRNVLINVQKLNRLDDLSLRKIMVPLERPHRKAIFCSDNEIVSSLQSTYLPENIVLCKNEEEVSNTFGLYLVERDKFIFKGERRKSQRIRVAIPVKVDIHSPEGEHLASNALITSLSEGGFYTEYLDLNGSMLVRKLRDLRVLDVKVTFKPPLSSSEETFKIDILRIETSSRQTGFAARFRR